MFFVSLRPEKENEEEEVENEKRERMAQVSWLGLPENTTSR